MHPFAFEASTVKLNVPATRGSPNIAPAGDRVMPFGKDPAVTVNVNGPLPPDAVSTWS